MHLKEVFGVVFHPEVTHISAKKAGRCEVKYGVETDGEGGFIYEKLFRDGIEIASNHPDVLKLHWAFMHQARGKVLLSGLGLGEMVFALLKNSQVKHVTVAEPDLQIAALVYPVIRSLPEPLFSKMTLFGQSIFDMTLKTGDHYDIIYHADTSGRSPEEVADLESRLAPFCDWQWHPGGI